MMLLMRVALRRRKDKLAPCVLPHWGMPRLKTCLDPGCRQVLSYVWALCPLPDQSRDGPELCPVLVRV